MDRRLNDSAGSPAGGLYHGQAHCSGARSAPDRAETMQIQFNGSELALEDACSIEQLLQRQGLGGRRVAVEVNGEIVPRSRHAEHVLATGDRVEVVHALGGG